MFFARRPARPCGPGRADPRGLVRARCHIRRYGSLLALRPGAIGADSPLLAARQWRGRCEPSAPWHGLRRPRPTAARGLPTAVAWWPAPTLGSSAGLRISGNRIPDRIGETVCTTAGHWLLVARSGGSTYRIGSTAVCVRRQACHDGRSRRCSTWRVKRESIRVEAPVASYSPCASDPAGGGCARERLRVNAEAGCSLYRGEQTMPGGLALA
jgi:hypothetical protein